MTSIHDLKLASETLEALNFLLQNTVDLEKAISSIDLTELKNINRDGGQFKERIEKLVAEIQNDKSSIEGIKRDIETKADATKEKIAEFDNTASTLNAKYAELAELQARLRNLEKDIKSLLSSGLINDATESTTQTFSSKKITKLLADKGGGLDSSQYRKIDDSYDKTQIDSKIDGLIGSAPAALNTLGKLAAALDNDTNFTTTISKKINDKLGKSEKAADSDKLDGLDSSAFAKVEDVYTKESADGRFLKIVDAIDAYSKTEADEKFLEKTKAKEFARKNELPTTASKTTLGLVKLTDNLNEGDENTALSPRALRWATPQGGIRLLPDTSEGTPWYFMLAVTYDEEILFWGRNVDMSIVPTLANNHIQGICSIYNPLKGKSKVKKIKIFSRSTYVLYENGDLYAMGQNHVGQIGVGNTSWAYTLTKSTDNVKDFWSSSAGYYHDYQTVISLKNDGTIWGVGYNSSINTLGAASLTNQVNWVKLSIPIETNDEIVSMKGHLTAQVTLFALTKNGKVYSCGYGTDGALGNNSTANTTTFSKISTLDGEKVIKLFTTGGFGSNSDAINNCNVLALCENGNIYVWGSNGYGELGLGFSRKVPVPTKLSLSGTYNAETNPVIDVICPPCGPSFFCLLLKNGDLLGSGYNEQGSLGDGTTTNKTSFIKIASDVKKAYATSSLRYAYPTLFYITKNNEMYVCGFNERGQAGIASSSSVRNPTLVKFSDVEKIIRMESCGYGGETTSLILTSDGKVYGSGYSKYGVATPYQSDITITAFSKVM